jgi:hypothetical protein
MVPSPLEVLTYDPWFTATCWLVLAVTLSCLGGVWRGLVMATVGMLAVAVCTSLMIVAWGASTA